jgi:hypothetical protein
MHGKINSNVYGKNRPNIGGRAKLYCEVNRIIHKTEHFVKSMCMTMTMFV